MSNLQKSGTRRTLTHCSAFSINRLSRQRSRIRVALAPPSPAVFLKIRVIWWTPGTMLRRG